jgi:DNA-binding NarL/FixJ family response regulator
MKAKVRQFVSHPGRVDSRRYAVGEDRRFGFREAVWQMKPSNSPSDNRKDFGLTTRERRVIALVGAGYTDRDIAQKFRISENTAKHQLTNVFDKLGVSNRFELVLFAVDQGLTQQD